MAMIEALESRALLSVAGALDTTFDGDGRGTVQFGTRRVDTVNASVVQPDGKIVIVGSTAALDGNGTDLSIGRLNADSTVDTTFGEQDDGTPGGGVVIIPLDSASDAAYGVALTPQGGILVAGSIADSSSGSFASLAIVLKLTPAGLADETFGTGVTNGDAGFVFINLSRSDTITQSSEARAVALQSSGQIIVAGAAEYDPVTGTANFAVTRLNPNGSVDRSFGEFGTGTEVDGVPGVLTEAYGVVVTPDQSILLTGTAIQPSDGFTPTVGIFVTAKLTPYGLPDNNFGDEAATYTVFPSIAGETVIPFATCLALQPDGKILSAGVVIHLNPDTGALISAFGVARYNPDGSPDLTFGETGAGATETFFSLADDSVANVGANQIVLQPNGKFLVVGRAALTSTDSFSSVALARYNADGTLDLTFNRTGKVLISPSGTTVTTLGIQTSGSSSGATGAFTSASAAQVELVPGGGILLLASQGAALNVTRLIADGPDLIATLAGVKTGSFIGGAKATAKLTISNQGTLTSAPTIPVTLRLSTDGTYSSDDILITTVTAKANVKPSTSAKALTLNFAYPKTGANGQYFVVASMNDARASAEGNYLNNAAVAAAPVTVAPPFADISATLILPPGSIALGKKTVFSVQLVNAGNVVAKGSVLIQLLASLDGAASDDDLRLLPSKGSKVSITPGKPLKLKLSGTAVAAGTFRLILNLDSSGIAGATDPVRSALTPSSINVG